MKNMKSLTLAVVLSLLFAVQGITEEAPVPISEYEDLPEEILADLLASTKKNGESPEEILAVLEDDQKTYFVRKNAIETAWGRKEPAILNALFRIAREDKDGRLRGEAIEALKGAALKGASDERLFPMLAKVIEQDHDLSARYAAYEALGTTKDARAYEILIAGLSDGNSGPYAARGLVSLGRKDAYPAVEKMFLQGLKEPFVVHAVPELLLALDEKRGVACLLGLLKGADENVARRILERLRKKKFKNDDVRMEMVNRLSSTNFQIRSDAIEALGDLGDASTPATLRQHYAANTEDRAMVAHTLGSLQDAESVAMLAEELRKTNSVLRQSVARALGRIKGPKALNALMDALPKEKDEMTKVLMLEALGLIGEKRALRVIIPLLHDTGYTAQPVPADPNVSYMSMSYPWNTRVSRCALWAACTIQDGRAPFPIHNLTFGLFNEAKLNKWETQNRERIEGLFGAKK
jgi:HEAT repeat protein